MIQFTCKIIWPAVIFFDPGAILEVNFLKEIIIENGWFFLKIEI